MNTNVMGLNLDKRKRELKLIRPPPPSTPHQNSFQRKCVFLPNDLKGVCVRQKDCIRNLRVCKNYGNAKMEVKVYTIVNWCSVIIKFVLKIIYLKQQIFLMNSVLSSQVCVHIPLLVCSHINNLFTCCLHTPRYKKYLWKC